MSEKPAERSKSHLLAVLLIVGVGAVLVARLPAAMTARFSDASFADPILDIAHLVDRYYYRDFDRGNLQLGAIRGMLDTLDDPYTEYIPPARQEEFDKVVRGEFVGIGAEIRMTEAGWLQIISPMDDSPSLMAGLQAGDLIVAVDGVSTWQRNINRIIESLTGRPGTEVRITVERKQDAGAVPTNALEATVAGETQVSERTAGELGGPGQPELVAPGPSEDARRFDLVITRDRIRTQTVRGLHRDGQDWLWMVDPSRGIAYVRISQFTNDTAARLPVLLSGLREQGMTALVLDLRLNAGGSMDAAIQVSNLFLESGEIVSVEGRRRQRSAVLAQRAGTLPDFPVAVLVDRASASASEIVAGALSDNGRAIVVGERTFGKGLVQAIVPLPSGSGQLKITEADYFLPSGRSLHRHPDSEVWGVDPTPGFEVPLTNDEFTTLWNILREEEVLRPGRDTDESRWSDPDWIRERLQDPPLAVAVSAIQRYMEFGEWIAPEPIEREADPIVEPSGS